jgi:hypothetical protein
MLRLLDSKTRIFFPCEPLGGGTASLSPFRRSPRSAFKRYFSPISLRRIGLLISLGQSLRVFDALSLIYSTSCYYGFRDTFHDSS